MHLFVRLLSPSVVPKQAKEKYLIWSIYPELSSSFPVVEVSKNQVTSGMRGGRKSQVVATIRLVAALVLENISHLVEASTATSGYAVMLLGRPYKSSTLHVRDIDLT